MNYSYQVILEQSIPIVTNLASLNSPVFIPIAGPDRIGKTTLAGKFRDELHEVAIVTTDVYLKNSREDRLRAAKEGKSGYWLEMHFVELLFSDLKNLKAGKPIRRRNYNPLDGTTTEVAGEYIEPGRYVIVDSGISLTDPFLDIYPPTRFGIFISADEEARRIIKDRVDSQEKNYGELYKRHSREEVELFINRNLEDCKRIVMPTREKADLVAEVDENYKVLQTTLQKPK